MSTKLKPLPFKIPKVEKALYHVQTDSGLSFYNRLHNHPEIQITSITKGSGTLICGEYMGEFNVGDVFVIGSNQGHIFKNNLTGEVVSSVTLFLDPSVFNNSIFQNEELYKLDKFKNDSSFGLRIVRGGAEISSQLNEIVNQAGLKQLVGIIRIVYLIVETHSYEALTNETLGSGKEDGRMNEIFQYSLENFQRLISIEEIANISAMTKASFCRYFKQRTGKTYTEYLSILRVNHACQLLHDKNYSINQACFDSGFANISHFNRRFKKIKMITPTTYRKGLLKSLE